MSEFGASVTQRIRLEYPGIPAPGDTYSTYVCCFDITQADFDEPHRAQLTYGGVDLFTTWIDDQGGVLIELFVFPNIGDPLLSVQLTDTTSNESITFETEIQSSQAGVADTLQAVIIDLENEVDSNPDSGDKLEEAISGLESALPELGEQPPDREEAADNVKDAVGEVEAAVSVGLITTVFGGTEADLLTAAIRSLARLSIAEAVERGGDQVKIDDAAVLIDAGDGHRAVGRFEDAVDAYKNAISRSEDA